MLKQIGIYTKTIGIKIQLMKKKKSKNKGTALNSRDLKLTVLKLFKKFPKKRFSAKQIIKFLKISNNKDSVVYVLDKLASEGKLFQVDDIKFRLDRFATSDKAASPRTTHTGFVDVTRKGSAYIVCEDLEEDVHVPAKKLGGALQGDKVKITRFLPPRRRRAEGEVIEVLTRAIDHFVGTMQMGGKYALVIPDRVDVPFDIIVRDENLRNAVDGEKVVVKVTEWTTKKNRNPFGKVTAVLGTEGGNDMEMHSILINNGFDMAFPDEVNAESEALSTEIPASEIAKRLDLREVTTFTIDPDTAKDFDDALSIQYLENDEIEIGVHIADVSHYVHPKTELDQEAYRRSTSVYLVDRVAPMLPEKISNELCSLRPNEDKLCFSAIFVFDKKHNITKRWFGKTIIHSDRRFTYDEAQQVLETGEGDFPKEVKEMNTIALRLRKKKFKNGAIAFESEEVKFRLDEDGKPIDVYVKERKDAHMLIEDFMLLANREVARYMAKKKDGAEIPFVYRVHDLPDPDKVANVAAFAKEMGFKMDLSTPRSIADSYNNLAKAARENDALKVLEPLAIRTMSKAEYTTENIGHYGLGFDFYTHFTSPIRRYSDVLVHRILEKNLEGVHRYKKDSLEEQCKHISRQERKASSAERESTKYKQVEYMMDQVGESFTGFINGMIDRGLFVELKDSKCEGMVGFETMQDVFELDDGRLNARGRRSKKVFKMGDEVRVKITAVNLERREIEMELED